MLLHYIVFFQYNFHLIVRTYFNVKLFFLSLEKIYMSSIFLSLSLFPKFCEDHSYKIVLFVIVYHD